MATGLLAGLRGNLISLLTMLCLLHAIIAEAKRDTPQENPANVAELQTKAEQGFVKQELELAADYFAGRGLPKDLSQAAYWYRKAADQGNPAAQLYLGYMCAAGIGVSQDQAQAIRWYRRSASSNNQEAKVNLAGFYMRGDGVKQDMEEGLRLLKSAAEKGYGRADAYLGLANYKGWGMPVDHAAAEAWFKMGVKLGDPEAEFFLSMFDEKEPGRVPDFAYEAKLLRLSAAGGYVQAFRNLGLLLANHPELPQAPQEATNTLMSAAGAGVWQSSAVLGILARDGRLLPRDQEVAYRWFRIAALQGRSQAETYLRPELKRLAVSIADTATAEQEAGAWLQLHPNHDVFVLTNGVNTKYFPLQEVYATAEAPNMEPKAGQSTEQRN